MNGYLAIVESWTGTKLDLDSANTTPGHMVFACNTLAIHQDFPYFNDHEHWSLLDVEDGVFPALRGTMGE
jgi:hypothetical protein